MSTNKELDLFRQNLDELIKGFESAKIAQKTRDGKLTRKDYASFLRVILPQVYSSSATFALAAARCSMKHLKIREYLFHHAEEEHSHWRWILDDLRSLGESDVPRPDEPSTVEATAYISLNYMISEKHPYARLGVAAFLEGVSGRLAGTYGAQVLKLLSLTKENAYFLFSHSQFDQGHIEDIFAVLKECDLSTEEWVWMNHAAAAAARLYINMLDSALS